MNIPLLDLKRQYQSIKPAVDAAIERVLVSGRFILGPEVEAFEEEVAEYCGVKHAIGVASGTDALLLSLRALGVGAGDPACGISTDLPRGIREMKTFHGVKNIPRAKVIIPSFTFFATAGVVHNVGATPVFCDIDPKTFNLDPEHVRRILVEDSEPRTTNNALRTSIKAIIPVHLYGQMADMDEIMALAEEYDLYVIEDAAQAIGAEYLPRAIPAAEAISRGRKLGNHEPRTTDHAPGPLARKAGTIGHLGCLSFFPTKNLGAYGDGGMVITNDDELAERVRMLRVHGSKLKYYHHMVGYNSRLDALQAAILRVKLPHLDEWTAARQRIATRYDELLQDVHGIETPYRALDRSHIFHQYTVRVKDGRRDSLQQYLKSQGIGTSIYYPLPLHLQECFRELGYKEGDLPNSEQASKEVLSLPVFPELMEEEQEYVVKSIKRFVEGESSSTEKSWLANG